jgi:glycosyltransferase involved in cell wall biosynthesis
MATGIPCITSDAAALPETVGDAAILFPSGNPAALAERLGDAARNPDALVPLTGRGQERAARFSVETFAERMIRAYDRAASRQGGSA